MASMWADLLGLSAMASKMGSAPFNRSKVILQAQDELVRLGRIRSSGKPYGLFDALARTVTVEGPLALWRGVLYDVALYLPTQALNFLLKDTFRKLSPFTRQQHGYGLWFLGTRVCVRVCVCGVRADGLVRACACAVRQACSCRAVRPGWRRC
jgi:hypothetical protein